MRIVDLGILNQLKDKKITAEALCDLIVDAIDKNLVVAGDKMPSTREIASYLGISRTTVMKVFDILIGRGYLSSSQGAGTWVSTNAATLASGDENGDSKHPGSNYRAHADHLTQSGRDGSSFEPEYQWGERFNDLARRLNLLGSEPVESTDFDEMNFGSSPTELMPLSVWRKTLVNLTQSPAIFEDATAFDANKEVFGYRPLREAIAGFLRRSKGMICDAEQIVLSSGVQSVISPVFTLLVKPGDLVICENPGFWGAREQFHSLGADIAYVPVDEDGLVVDALDELVLKENRPAQWLYLPPSCQEPYGVTLSEDRRVKLLAWCKASGTAILEDDWDSEFHYDRTSVSTLYTLDKTGSVVYFYSFWRLLYPLVSVGFLVIPHQLIEVFASYKNVWDREFTLVEHRVLTELLNEGHVETHMRSMWKSYRKRRQTLIFALTKCFGHRAEVLSSSTGMHVVVRFNEDWSHKRVMESAASAQVPIADTTPYYAHAPRLNEFMVRFSSIPQDEIESRIESFAKTLASQV